MVTPDGELKLQCSIQSKDSIEVDKDFESDGILGLSMTEHPHNGPGGTIIIGLKVDQVCDLINHLGAALDAYRRNNT